MQRFIFHGVVALMFALCVTVGVFLYIQYEIARSHDGATVREGTEAGETLVPNSGISE